MLPCPLSFSGEWLTARVWVEGVLLQALLYVTNILTELQDGFRLSLLRGSA